jgi:two-component system LytT family response regulator
MEGGNIKFIPVPIDNRQIIIRTDSILYCEADNKHTNLVLTDGSIIKASRCLCYIEQLFEDCGFFRCHKSYLVNGYKVKEFFSENNVRYTRLKNDLTVKISRNLNRDFKQFMTKLCSEP